MDSFAPAQFIHAPPVAVVQGATTGEIQALLLAFLASLPPGLRAVGVVEEQPPGDDRDASARLRSLSDGRTWPIFQDLGPSSTACGLDAESVVGACEAVRRDIAAGCDLVVLSKFGKLEAERTGLADAFAEAIAAGAPILTSVSPKQDAAWRAFAEPLFVMLPPDLAAIQRWWRETAAAQAQRAPPNRFFIAPNA